MKTFRLSVLLCVVLSFALGDVRDASANGPSHATLSRMYKRAIRDAETAEPGEISRRLTAIVERNNDLVWKGEAGRRRVLVVTWTSSQAFDSLVGQTTDTSKIIWVTVAPELQRFVRARRPRDIRLRCAQVLGLPPDTAYDRFVELWVDPEDLFRPTPDPEITDHEAELDFPRSRAFLTVNQDYVAWFEQLKQTSYGPDGYPWTRLGYTYDWGDPKHEIGLSEFVIRKGATVEVRRVVGTRAYFAGRKRYKGSKPRGPDPL